MYGLQVQAGDEVFLVSVANERYLVSDCECAVQFCVRVDDLSLCYM